MQRPVPPEIEGYLSKLKSKYSLFGSWAKRYYRVNQSTAELEYFDNKTSTKPIGAISLVKLTRIQRFDDTSFQIEALPTVTLLRTESQAELACWTSALEKYLDEKMRYESYVHTKQATDNEKMLNMRK